MENIVKGMMELTLLCSVMILVVLLLRVVWGKKMHRSILSMLWLLALVRLLLPMTLESPIHLDQLTISVPKEADVTSVAPDANNHVSNHQPNIENDEPTTYTEAVSPANDEPLRTDARADLHVKPTVDIYPIALMLWILGTGVVLLCGSIRTMMFYYKVMACAGTKDRWLHALLNRNKAILGIKKPIKIITSQHLSTPIAFGVLSPTIFIPTHYLTTVSGDKLSLMIMHELVHIKRKDMLKNYLWFVARAIHWFNPLVWLAYRSYRDDVEMACDQMVLRMIRRDDPTVYCQSLLDVVRFAKHPATVPSVLSFCENPSNLRRRIETMIKPHGNHKAVTAFVIIMAVMMVVGCFTTACQPTPEKTVVDDKNKSIESVIKENKAETTDEPITSNQEVEPKGFMATYETPETATGTYEFPNITIMMDAEVIVPETDSIASIVYTPKELTQERADAFRKYFVGDAELYERITHEDTKGELEPQLTFWQEELFKCETNWEEQKERDYYDDDFSSKSEAIAHLKDKIKDIERRISRAPDKAEYKPISVEVIDDPEAPGNQRLFANAKIPEGNRDGMAQLMISGRPGRSASYIYDNLVQVEKTNKSQEELQKDMQLTLEDAVSMAKKTAYELGSGDLALREWSIRQHVKDGRYVPYYSLLFTQSVSGLSAMGYHEALAMTTNMFAPQTPVESIMAYVDDEGVAVFTWDGMQDVVEVLDKDVKILGFDEIMSIFNEKIGQHVYAENQTEVKITKVSLGCMMIPVKDDPSKCVAVPVWDFRGYHYDANDTEGKDKIESLNIENWTYLTVNAVDGSIISRRRGY